ncbi:MAG TPA: formate dehydrogenase accessory sulfurtransferase FdhD [Polyangiaceae bacterium]|nr:formate dehydrogenase accessory sulfurtransferase FdhD [Polyangiaceae bacterium]
MNARLPPAVQIAAVQAYRSAGTSPTLEEHPDELAVEEPLEIRIAGEPLAVTMRTPGHDHELVAGLLLAEGVIGSRADLGGIQHCARLGTEGARNTIDVLPAAGVVLAIEATRRGTLTTSACGVCGRQMIDDLLQRLRPVSPCPPVRRAFIASLSAELEKRQPTFQRTGGLHGAGIATSKAGLCVVREDVGRHNAVDKAIGRLVLDGQLPALGAILVVSGRISFEIVQKALAAGLCGVVGVSAPSSLAVSTAARFGLLLCGFARGDKFNVYAGAERLSD